MENKARQRLIAKTERLEYELGEIKRQLSQEQTVVSKDWLDRAHRARAIKIKQLQEARAALRNMRAERDQMIGAVFVSMARQNLEPDVFDDIMTKTQAAL